MSKSFYSKGLKFQCQGSGKCCLSRGEYGFVYLTKKDISRFAKHFNVSEKEFVKVYCENSDGLFHLKEEGGREECQFLENNRCTTYEARPTQCRTWPFWPENMNAKSWSSNVVKFCPGAGKGKAISSKEITQILEEQKKADESIGL